MRVMTTGRQEDVLSSGEPDLVVRRGSLTLPQVVGLGVLALAQFFDWASFLVLVSRHGLAAEANPIVVRIAQTAGKPGLPLPKVATVGFAALLMFLIAPKRRKLAYGLLVFGIAAGMVGGLSNVASL